MGKKTDDEKIFRQQQKFKDRRTIALGVIINHAELIPLLKDKYITDDILEEGLMEEPAIFKFIPHPSQRIIDLAVDLDGGNLQYIPKKIRKTLPVSTFIMALDSNPVEAIKYVPKKMLPEETKQRLFELDPKLITDNDINIAQGSFLKERIRENPQDIKFIKNPTNELKCIALRSDPNVALYFETLTPEMMDIIDEMYPSLKEALPNYTR